MRNFISNKKITLKEKIALKSGSKFNKTEILKSTEEILRGLTFLHDSHIIHRDIKPEYKILF